MCGVCRCDVQEVCVRCGCMCTCMCQEVCMWGVCVRFSVCACVLSVYVRADTTRPHIFKLYTDISHIPHLKLYTFTGTSLIIFI